MSKIRRKEQLQAISVLSLLSRLFERVVQDQLFEFIKQNKIVAKSQFVHRKLYSTITSLIDSTGHWLANSDNQMLNMVTFLDLKKAFDTVDHKILIEKLSDMVSLKLE